MKRVLSLTLAIILCVPLCACNKEASGVPQRQIEQDWFQGGREYVIEDCTHDIDKDLHCDTVTMKYYTAGTYYNTHNQRTATYQYDKSTDIWSEIPNSRKYGDTYYTLNDALRGKSFTGTEGTGSLKMRYHIVVKGINMEEYWIHATYRMANVEVEYTGDVFFEYGALQAKIENTSFKVVLSDDLGLWITH